MRGTLSKLVLLSVMLGFAQDTEGRKATTIMASGGSIDVFVAGEKGGVAYEDLIQWVNAASNSVATYFGRYPVPRAEVRITRTEGRGVHHGMKFGSPSVRITISVGSNTELGVQRSQNGDISFTDDAPLSSVRNSIGGGYRFGARNPLTWSHVTF